MLSKYDLDVDKAARERGCNWTAPNGPGFAGLYAGDVVEFAPACGRDTRTASVLPLLVFADHVQVRYGACGYTVNAANFVRLVRRGKRHMQADARLIAEEKAARWEFPQLYRDDANGKK